VFGHFVLSRRASSQADRKGRCSLSERRNVLYVYCSVFTKEESRRWSE